MDDKDRDEDHARLPRMKQARDVQLHGNAICVYHWPEDRPEEEAKVKVYMLVRINPLFEISRTVGSGLKRW